MQAIAVTIADATPKAIPATDFDFFFTLDKEVMPKTIDIIVVTITTNTNSKFLSPK